MSAAADKVAELAAEIARKESECARLARELANSLRVQAVWPDAFKGGHSCTLCARMTQRDADRVDILKRRGKRPELKRAFLRRGDGVEHDIDAATYWELRDARL